MEIPNVTYVSSTDSNSLARAATKALGKDDFLKLLVAKLSHQDPLNPSQDEDFVAQLAQFSSLEQLSNMNDNLTQDMQWNYLLSQTISNTMATSLIGRSVRADSSEVYLEESGSADLLVNLDRTATDLTITITDENGNTVRTISQGALDEGDHIIKWDGKDDNGAQVAAGVYSINVSATDGDGETFTPDRFLEGKVTSVTYKDGIAMLNINGQLIPLSSVQEVKEG